MEFSPTTIRYLTGSLFFLFGIFSLEKEVWSWEMLCSVLYLRVGSGQWPEPDHGSLSNLPSESVMLRISGAEYWNFIAGPALSRTFCFFVFNIFYHCYNEAKQDVMSRYFQIPTYWYIELRNCVLFIWWCWCWSSIMIFMLISSLIMLVLSQLSVASHIFDTIFSPGVWTCKFSHNIIQLFYLIWRCI